MHMGTDSVNEQRASIRVFMPLGVGFLCGIPAVLIGVLVGVMLSRILLSSGMYIDLGVLLPIIFSAWFAILGVCIVAMANPEKSMSNLPMECWVATIPWLLIELVFFGIQMPVHMAALGVLMGYIPGCILLLIPLGMRSSIHSV
jgi:membrane associated rhomboid family serine protease